MAIFGRVTGRWKFTGLGGSLEPNGRCQKITNMAGHVYKVGSSQVSFSCMQLGLYVYIYTYVFINYVYNLIFIHSWHTCAGYIDILHVLSLATSLSDRRQASPKPRSPSHSSWRCISSHVIHVDTSRACPHCHPSLRTGFFWKGLGFKCPIRIWLYTWHWFNLNHQRHAIVQSILRSLVVFQSLRLQNPAQMTEWYLTVHLALAQKIGDEITQKL